MSMKVMQNYQYLMQSQGNNDQNFKNLTFNNIHYKNCICNRFEGSDHTDKRFIHSNTFCKLEDEFHEKELDVFHRIRDASGSRKLDTPDLFNNNRSLTSVDFKKNNHSNVDRVQPEECSSTYSKEMESNVYHKISNNMPMSSRSELSNMYSGFDTAEIHSKKQVSRLYSKDLIATNLFARKNMNLGLFSKRYNSNLYMKQNDNSVPFVKMSENIGGTTLPNLNISMKNQENENMYEKRIDNSNDTENVIDDTSSEPRESENSETCCKNQGSEEDFSKGENNINMKCIPNSSFDEDAQSALARKQLLAHSGIKLNLCDVCKKSFSTKGNLQNHHVVHSGQKPHECEVCKKTFSQRSTLGKHYLIHTGEKPHICNVCGRGFRQANNLRIHLLTHSGEKPHLCNICDKGFTQKIALQKHMLTHTGVKPHECDVCKRCFTTKGNLQKHFLTHTGEKPHICNICNRGFSQKIALKKHHLTHTGEKPHPCNICGKRFTTKGNLKSHFKRHTRDKVSVSQSVSVSSVAQSLLVPKSIAQSIMSPSLLQHKDHPPVSAPPSNNHASLPATKSALSVFSSHIQHPLALTNPVTSSIISSANISTMAHSFAIPKSHVTSYTVPNQHFSVSPSHSLSPTTFSQPSDVSASTPHIPVFQSPTLTISSHSVPFSSQLQNTGIQSMYSHDARTSTLPSHAHKQVYTSQILQHSSLPKSSVHPLSSEEPLGLTTDSLSMQITRGQSPPPLQTLCSAPVTKNGMRGDKMPNATVSDMHNHSIPSAGSQNPSVQTSPGTIDKPHLEQITIL